MDFGEQLKAIAKESGQKTIQGQIAGKVTGLKKSEDMNAFAAALGNAKLKAEKSEEIVVSTELGPVKVWSFSALKNHETCQWITKLAKVDKEKQKDSEAAARGSIVHDMCEEYVRGLRDDLVGDKKTKLDKFQDDFVQLNALFKEGQVSCEENWGIRADWSPCEWSDDELWGRAKLDAFVRESDTSCRIIDYKTGRKFGNEMKHNDQGLSYALYVFHREPEMQLFRVEFWYLDQGEKMIRDFTRKQLSILLPRYHDRANRMTSCKEFIPKPNVNACRFCPYGSNKNKDGSKQYGTGVCAHDFYRNAA